MNTVRVTVANSSEWQIPMQLEVLINKNKRRRINPELIYNVTGLDADKYYSMGITIYRFDDFKYRHYETEWVPQSDAEPYSAPPILKHRDGIMTGEQWMRIGVNFKYLVVSNTLNVQEKDHLYVEPLHMYQPRLEIICVEDPKTPRYFPISEQKFIAVTKHSEMFKNAIKPQRNERKRALKGMGMERSAKRSRHEPEDVVQEPVVFEEIQQEQHQVGYQMGSQEMYQEQYQDQVNSFERQADQGNIPVQNFGQQPIREQYQRGLNQMEYGQASIQGQFAPASPHYAYQNDQQQQYPPERLFQQGPHQVVQNVQVVNFETHNNQVHYRYIPVQNVGQHPVYEQQQQGCHQMDYGQAPIQGHYAPAHHGQQQEQYPQERVIQHVHPTVQQQNLGQMVNFNNGDNHQVDHGSAQIQQQVDPIIDQNVEADQPQNAIPEVENQENVAPEIEREEPVFDAEFFDNNENWNFNKNAPREEHNNNLNVPLFYED